MRRGFGLRQRGERRHPGGPLLGDQADGPNAHGGIGVLERAGEERIVEEIGGLQDPEGAQTTDRVGGAGQSVAELRAGLAGDAHPGQATFGENLAGLPDEVLVGVGQGDLDEFRVGERRQVAGAGDRVAVADAVDAAVGAVPDLLGIIVADLDVGPVADVEGTVWSHALRHRDERGVVAAQEVIAVVAGETTALGQDLIRDETMAVEIAEDEHPTVGFGEIVPVVDCQARVGVTAADGVGAFRDLERIRAMDAAARIVRVVGDCLDVVVGEGIEVLPRLTLVARAGKDVIEVRDHAGRVEELSAGVVIQAPRIARAFGEDLEDVASRVKAPDAGVDLHALVIGRTRLTDDRVREDAVVTVEPAIRTPDEAVERLVRVVETPAVEQHDWLARLVVRVLWDEEKFRSRTDPDAAVADFDTGDEIESVLEDCDLRVTAVLLHVFQNQDPIGALPVGTFLWVGHAFHHPEAATFVEAHRDRLDDLGLGGDKRDLEARRERHGLHRVGCRLAGLISTRLDVFDRAGRQGRSGDAGGNEEEREESHGGVRYD